MKALLVIHGNEYRYLAPFVKKEKVSMLQPWKVNPIHRKCGQDIAMAKSLTYHGIQVGWLFLLENNLLVHRYQLEYLILIHDTK